MNAVAVKIATRPPPTTIAKCSPMNLVRVLGVSFAGAISYLAQKWQPLPRWR